MDVRTVGGGAEGVVPPWGLAELKSDGRWRFSATALVRACLFVDYGGAGGVVREAGSAVHEQVHMLYDLSPLLACTAVPLLGGRSRRCRAEALLRVDPELRSLLRVGQALHQRVEV